jgi:hypothetical protein
MKLKSNILFTALATVLCFVSVAYMSCKKNTETFPCNGKHCYNGGSCSSGKCVCPFGYETDSCSAAFHDKFLGIYDVTSTVIGSDSTKQIGKPFSGDSFTTHVTAGATPTSLFMSNWVDTASYNNVLGSIDSNGATFRVYGYQPITNTGYNITSSKDTFHAADHSITGVYTTFFVNSANNLQRDTIKVVFTYKSALQ